MRSRKSVSLYARIKVKYLRLILKGFKILEEKERYNKFYFIIQNFSKGESITQRYNKYKFFLVSLLGIYISFYIKHNYFQPEFEVRRKPNILIPQGIYDVRRKHYIYWEISRVARGERKTFTYYNYDKESVLKFIK
jgi:hypothetical protein